MLEFEVLFLSNHVRENLASFVHKISYHDFALVISDKWLYIFCDKVKVANAGKHLPYLIQLYLFIHNDQHCV